MADTRPVGDVMKSEITRGKELLKRIGAGDRTLCPGVKGGMIDCFNAFIAKTDITSADLFSSLSLGAAKAAFQDKTKFGVRTTSYLMLDSVLKVEEKFDVRKHILSSRKNSASDKYALSLEEKSLNEGKAKVEAMVREKLDSLARDVVPKNDPKSLAWQNQMKVNLEKRLMRLKTVAWNFPATATEITQEELARDPVFAVENKRNLDQIPRNYCSNPKITQCTKIPVGQCVPYVTQLLIACDQEVSHDLPARFPASDLGTVYKTRGAQTKSCFVSSWAALVRNKGWQVPGCQ